MLNKLTKRHRKKDNERILCEYIWMWHMSGSFIYAHIYIYVGFPGGTRGKESTCQWRRHKRCKFDPWTGKIPWRRKWQPTPVSLPGKSHDRAAWRATVHRFTKSQTQLKRLNTHTCIHIGTYIYIYQSQFILFFESAFTENCILNSFMLWIIFAK